MKNLSGVIGLTVVLFAFGHGQAFIHQKLASGFSDVGTGLLTPDGIPYWSGVRTSSPNNLDIFRLSTANNLTSALLGNNRTAYPVDFHLTSGLLWEGSGTATGGVFDVFVNNTNISASVVGANRFVSAFRFTPDGQPLWYGSGNNNGNQADIFRGSTNLTSSVLGTGRDAVPAAINANNFLLWDGTGSTNTGNRDVFRTNLTNNTTSNLSQAPLGTSRFAIATALNANNDAVWYGSGSSNGQYNDVFFNSTNISLSVVGGGNPSNARDAIGFDVSGNNVLWQGRSGGSPSFYDTYATTIGGGTQNLSSSALGTGRDSLPVGINGSAILWEGIGGNTSNNYDVFVSTPSATRNLSTNRFSSGARESQGNATYSSGNAFWLGKHSTTSNFPNLFHYQWSANQSTNLTQEAVGATRESLFLASNSAEQVLWAVRNSAGTEWEIYLSTPNTLTTLQGTVTGFAGNPSSVQLIVQLINPITGAVAHTHTTNLTSASTYSVSVTPGLWRLRIRADRSLVRAFDERRLLGTVTLNLNLVLGDVNGDNVVDDADLLEILFAFGSTTTAPADVNADGVVDDADLLIVLFAFGSTGE